MSAHWAMQRWTFGAGHVALRPVPYRGADGDVTLFQGLALVSQEWSRAGRSRRSLGVSALALLLGAWLAATLIAAALRDRKDENGLEIVMLEALPLPEPEAIPEPEPIAPPEPVIEAAEPEPIAKPEPIAEPAPIAKPERIAARQPAPPPRPEPAPVAKPVPAPLAKPAPPRAVVAKPAPAPIARPAFVAAPAPAPAPRSVAPPPPQQQPVQVARPSLPKPVIKIDAVAAPAAPAPAPAPASQPARLALRPSAAPVRARPAPSFDLGAPAAPGLSNETTPPVATARATTAPSAAPRATARSVARPPASLALPALDAGRAVRDPGADPTPSRVAARDPEPPSGSGRSHSNDPKLRGVSLGSLASCVSDREEDALKQQLVALVGEPGECKSEAGRYRFVETRNLNAFLMWVERAPARPEADRCVELTHALACVRKHAGRESRRG